MATFLFDEIIFGPVNSRRLGKSLGVNLLPLDRKICNFDCIYCECGWSSHSAIQKSHFPTAQMVETALRQKLETMLAENNLPNTITFAGNGEPTMHPEFNSIIDSTIQLRNQFCPESKIAVLSNATLISRKNIAQTLAKIDLNILKLDSAINQTINHINKPKIPFSVDKLIDNLLEFKKKITLQTLFFSGEFNNQFVDNTTDREVDALLEVYNLVQPELVMIYTIARDTPAQNLQKATAAKLDEIAKKIEAIGLKVQISY